MPRPWDTNAPRGDWDEARHGRQHFAGQSTAPRPPCLTVSPRACRRHHCTGTEGGGGGAVRTMQTAAVYRVDSKAPLHAPNAHQRAHQKARQAGGMEPGSHCSRAQPLRNRSTIRHSIPLRFGVHYAQDDPQTGGGGGGRRTNPANTVVHAPRLFEGGGGFLGKGKIVPVLAPKRGPKNKKNN